MLISFLTSFNHAWFCCFGYTRTIRELKHIHHRSGFNSWNRKHRNAVNLNCSKQESNTNCGQSVYLRISFKKTKANQQKALSKGLLKWDKIVYILFKRGAINIKWFLISWSNVFSRYWKYISSFNVCEKMYNYTSTHSAVLWQAYCEVWTTIGVLLFPLTNQQKIQVIK